MGGESGSFGRHISISQDYFFQSQLVHQLSISVPTVSGKLVRLSDKYIQKYTQPGFEVCFPSCAYQIAKRLLTEPQSTTITDNDVFEISWDFAALAHMTTHVILVARYILPY